MRRPSGTGVVSKGDDDATVPVELPESRRQPRSTGEARIISGPKSTTEELDDEDMIVEDPLIGQVVGGRYKVVRPLGEGGMGMVYLAEHVTLHKLVALKTIRPELAAEADLAARFAREALAAGALDHPHVASAIDHGELEGGGAYLVMQFARGVQLRDELEGKGKLPWARAANIALQITDALEAAHAQRIIHRDLKPDNVMLETRPDGSDHVRVLDFGIARMAGDPSSPEQNLRPLTKVGMVMGTPGYMPPEQAIGERIDARADLYALGVCLYEMIVGHPPFRDDDLRRVLTMQMTTQAPPVSAASGDPTVPPELDAVIRSLLASTPQSRPKNAGEVRVALRGILKRASILPPSGTARVPTPSGQQRPAAIAYAPTLSPTAAVAPLPTETPRPITRPAKAVTNHPASTLLPIPLPLIAGGCAALGALAFVFALLLYLVVGGLSPDTPEVPTTAPTTVTPPPIPTLHAVPPTLPAQGRGTRSPPAAPHAVRAPAPPAIWADFRALDGSASDEGREAAARRIALLESSTDLPPVVAAAAHLELATSCTARKRWVHRLGDIGDVRALPQLVRLSRLPHTGCGFLGLRDCHRCVRRELSRTIESLRGDGPVQTTPG